MHGHAYLLPYLEALQTETDNNNEGTRFKRLFPSCSLPLSVVGRIRHIPPGPSPALAMPIKLGCASRTAHYLDVWCKYSLLWTASRRLD